MSCETDTSTDEQTLNVTCYSNGSWIPDPTGFTCSPTAPSGISIIHKKNIIIITFITFFNPQFKIIYNIIFIDPLLHAGFNNKAFGNTLLIIITILSGAILILLIILTLCAIKRKCVAIKTSVEDPKQQPIYDDIKPYFEEIQVEGNAAYGHVIQCHNI